MDPFRVFTQDPKTLIIDPGEMVAPAVFTVIIITFSEEGHGRAAVGTVHLFPRIRPPASRRAEITEIIKGILSQNEK